VEVNYIPSGFSTKERNVGGGGGKSGGGYSHIHYPVQQLEVGGEVVGVNISSISSTKVKAFKAQPNATVSYTNVQSATFHGI